MQNRVDEYIAAWNAHDAKATSAFLDKSFFGALPFASSKMGDVEAGKAQLERDAAAGARSVRSAIVMKADDNGDAVWFIGDYFFSPKVPPGALPVRRPTLLAGISRRSALRKPLCSAITIDGRHPRTTCALARCSLGHTLLS